MGGAAGPGVFPAGRERTRRAPKAAARALSLCLALLGHAAVATASDPAAQVPRENVAHEQAAREHVARDDAKTDTLDPVRITASVLPTTAAAASQHVTVLERADLDALRGQSLPEILARQAGIVIDRGPRGGGFGALYLRGADPSHVVVLIDHVRQNDALSSRGSAVDLNGLSTDDVERIEIVRGNASVANAEALAGLIHIFTRRGTPGGGAGADIGGDGLRAGHASWAARSVRAGAAWREDGDGAGGFGRTRSANAGWEHAWGEAAALSASARFGDSVSQGFPDDSGGDAYAVVRDLESRRSRNRQVSLRGEFKRGAGALEAQLAMFARDGEEDSPGVAPGLRDPFGLPPIAGATRYRRDEAHAAWLLPARESLLLTAGAQYQRERGRFDSLIAFGPFLLPASFDARRAVASAFAEARWYPGAWIVQGGLRHERPDGGASSTHPTLSLQRTLAADRGQWGVSAARSEKRPSFYALGHPLVGNPALRPERALHRELYYANAPAAAWPTRLTLFSARYRDLVDFDAGPPPQLVNRARIEADGLEWRSERRFANDWRLQLDGAWMRLRDPDGGAPLRYRPRLQAAAQLATPLGGARELSLRLRHLGRRYDSSIPTGDRWLAASNMLDLALRQALGAAQLVVGVDNAGNARDEETIGNALPGRRLRLSVHWPLP